MAHLYLRWSKTAVQWIAVFVLAAMVAINAAEIGWRVAFTHGLNWVQELSIVLAMTLYFLAYSVIAKEREYIRIDLLPRMLPRRARRLASMATRVLVLAFHALVAWYAFQTTRFSALFETPVLGWPEAVFYAPLALGCADIVLTELIHFVQQLRGETVDDERAGILT